MQNRPSLVIGLLMLPPEGRSPSGRPGCAVGYAEATGSQGGGRRNALPTVP
jgi:hypothetical protein